MAESMNQIPSTKGQWQTGSLVTPKGKAAFIRKEQRVNDLIFPLLEEIEKKTQNPAMLYADFNGAKSDDVREAVWRLLDMGFIQITEKRMLEIKPRYSAELLKALQVSE